MQPGVVYTTFHFPGTEVNVVTTEFADWATDCPEYKVTAVQVSKTFRSSDWQVQYSEGRAAHTRFAADMAKG
jgi:formate dehydrogenase major subunit